MSCELICTGEALVTIDDLIFYFFLGCIVYLDYYFTRKSWEKIKIIEPKINFGDFELNKIAVTLVNKFGEKNGFRAALLFSYSLLALLVTFLNPIIIYFISGMYSCVFAWHINNLAKLNGILEERKKKKNFTLELARKRLKKERSK